LPLVTLENCKTAAGYLCYLIADLICKNQGTSFAIKVWTLASSMAGGAGLCRLAMG
jgi:hypothetical protein